MAIKIKRLFKPSQTSNWLMLFLSDAEDTIKVSDGANKQCVYEQIKLTFSNATFKQRNLERKVSDYYYCEERNGCLNIFSNNGKPIVQFYEEDDRKQQYCEDCILMKFPSCSLNIPCCKCDEDCNSRQPCQKKGGAE